MNQFVILLLKYISVNSDVTELFPVFLFLKDFFLSSASLSLAKSVKLDWFDLLSAS